MMHKTNDFPLTVAFVCAGNTCRSPMAEYLFKYFSEKEKLNADSFSRGLFIHGYTLIEEIHTHKEEKLNTYILEQSGMSVDAILALKLYDSKIRGMEKHSQRFFELRDFQSADLILTATELMALDLMVVKLDYEKKNKVKIETVICPLKKYAGIPGNPDIEDPVPSRFAFFSYSEAYAKLVGLAPDKSYIKCRNEIISCLKILVEDLKHPKKFNEKIQKFDEEYRYYCLKNFYD